MSRNISEKARFHPTAKGARRKPPRSVGFPARRIVKCGKEKDWSEVKKSTINASGYRITQNMMFENRQAAEDWCQEKGLL